MTMRFNAHALGSDASPLNLDTLVAGSVVPGNTVEMGDNTRQKVRNLSARVLLDVETASLTVATKWQVSNDGTNWVDVANGPQNAAAVVLGTGTGGADAAIAKVIPAPEAVYGWRKARIALVTAGATGAAVDTYTMGYCYRAGA